MPDPPPVSLRWGDAEPRHEPLVRRSNPAIMEVIPNLSTGLEARGRVSQGREGLTPYVLQENEGVGIKRTRSSSGLSARVCESRFVLLHCGSRLEKAIETLANLYLRDTHIPDSRYQFPRSPRRDIPVRHVDEKVEMEEKYFLYKFGMEPEYFPNGKYFPAVAKVDGNQGTYRADFFDSVFRKSGGFLYGGMYNEVSSFEEETQEKSERKNGWLANLNRPTDKEMEMRQNFFANLGSVEDLKDFMVNTKRVLQFIMADDTTESTSTSVEFSHLSVSEEFRLSILKAMSSQNWEKVESLIMPIAVALPERAAVYRAVVILAAFFLSVVYQYLIGLLHRGGANIHSSGSFEFRSTYISIVLFQGAYVWIKFRDAAPPSSKNTPRGLHRIYKKNNLGELFQGAYVWIKFRDVAPESQEKPSPGLYRKSQVNEWGVRIYSGKYEPRFKPCDSIDSYISVGSFAEEEDGKTMYQILAFFYGKGEGKLRLVGGGTYPIAPMTVEEQRHYGSENYPLPPMSEKDKIFCDKKKREFVKGKTKAAFNEYNRVLTSIPSGWIQSPEIQSTRDICNTVRPLPDCADASAGSGQMEGGGIRSAEEGYLGNQGRDAIVSVSSGDCCPDVGPVPQGIQHMANDRLGDHVVGGAGHLTVSESSMRSLPETATNIPANGAAVPCEQPRELQFQHGSLQENQANNSAINIIPDDLSQVQRQVIELQRQVKELQRQSKESERQRQLDQLQIRQQQPQISESESRISKLERQQQLQQLRNQQQESRISELERQQKLEQLRTEQQESRFLELESRFSEFEGTVLEHSRKRPLRSHSET